MAKVIKVGGLKASSKELANSNENKSDDKKTNSKKKTTTTSKAKKKKSTKKEVIKDSSSDIKEELNKTDNLPSAIKTTATVTDDNVKLDLSNMFGEGTYAELNPEDSKDFIENEKNIPIVDSDKKEEKEEEIPQEILAGGNPKAYCYLSLKATGIYNPDIISFALVSDEGKIFYGELKDLDIMKITPDILVNVLQKRFNLKQDDITEGRVAVTGDGKYVRSKLLNWIREEYTNKGITMQIVSDKVINEFCLFMEFLLNGILISQYSQIVSPVCIDLNTILSSNINIERQPNMSVSEFIKGYIPAHIALDIDRLSILEDESIPREFLGNAVVNAQVIRRVFRKIYGFDKNDNIESVNNQ
jgi:hypothetical protein